MNFQELADAIADGEIMGTPTFNLFLQKGIDHWQEKAATPGVHSETFAHLAAKYAAALYGSNLDRMKFCQDEAAYLLQLANEMEQGGVDPQRTQGLKDRAANWQKITMSFTLTGEDFANM